MDIKSLSKIYFSRLGMISLLLIFLFQLTNCSDEVSIETINVELNNSETYKYPIVSGDEGGAVILAQAKHFEVSEVIRNSETNYAAVYTYKPKTNYVGNDSVELQIKKGSDGASEPTKIKTIKINFSIINQF
jgi:hypothetical protein